jgi:hypothetical protein
MKTFMFRCVKITFEEKRSVRLDGGDERQSVETIVSVQFEQANELTGPTLHGHAYMSLSLSDEEFKELGYRVGKVYSLSPT